MSKDTNDLLWLAIIGVTSQYLSGYVHRDKYIDDVFELQKHVTRHNHRPQDDEQPLSVSALRLTFGEELQLSLYRHWSLFESLLHSSYTANVFRVWTMKGKNRLYEYLADMGLPLVQCKQKFASMDIAYRDGAEAMMRSQIEKYQLNEQELFLPSFNAQYGYRHKYCSADVMFACQALLETSECANSEERFVLASSVLSRCNEETMARGLQVARLQLEATVRQIQSFLDTHLIAAAGPFLYCFVQEGTSDSHHFAHALCLERLGRFTLNAYCSTTKNAKRARTLPLVLGGPTNDERGTIFLVGVPPLTETSCKSFFGKAFDAAGKQVNARLLQDHFHPHIVELKVEDKNKFLDALISVMQ